MYIISSISKNFLCAVGPLNIRVMYREYACIIMLFTRAPEDGVIY